MTTTSNSQSDALAAWESAAVLNLGPVLDPDTTVAVWDAVLAYRAAGDVDAFAKTVRAAVRSSPESVRDLVERAIATIPVTPARPIVSPAAAEAKE